MGREEEETLASTSNSRTQIPSSSHLVKSPASILTRDPKNISEVTTDSSKKIEGRKMSAEMAKLVANFQILISCSNATPLRALHGLNYTCYFCDKQYPDPADLKNHTLKSHQDFRHTSSTRLPTLYNYSVKLDITELTCRFCFQPFDQFFGFMDHLRLEHDQPIHTDVKNYMLPFKFDSNPPKCVLCDTEFNTFRNLVEHMNIHFRNFVCEVCGAGFINRASWKTHKANHDYGDFPCTKCPQVFSSMLKLRNHDRYLHLGLGKRNKCAYCGEKFSCLILKNNHMVKEHGVAKTAAKCKACDKTFSNYANLRLHKRRFHLQEKKVKCPECEMMFRDSHALKEHMVKHTGVRDFKCSICDKAYGRKDTLKEHLRIHANDRKFKCQYCKMAFVQKCSLKSHLYSKHGNPRLLTDSTVKLSGLEVTEMDGNDLIAPLIEDDEIDYELLLDLQGTDKNQEVIESRQDETPSPAPFCTEYIFKYESNSQSPSADHSSDQFDPESPSNAERIDELEEISSNIEYLDETEVEYRLTERIQRSKETVEHEAEIESRDVNADKPNKSSNLSDINMKTVIEDMEEYDRQVQYHHENLRTVLRCSNATTFLCRGIWYLCTLCRTKYTDPSDLKAHTLKAHKSLKSQRKLYSARKMNRYIVKLDITDLQCKLCSIEIDSLKDLMEHLNSDHGEPVHRDLPNHMIPFKFDGDVLRCTECDREFAFFKMLQCHMNDHYKNFTCEVCDTGYVSFGSLVQHMRLHADGEYKCKWCQKLFHNKHKLADHVKLVHFGHKMRNKCAYCDMKFLVFETRNKHMEEEHGLKAPVVQCQACTKTFRSTRHLTAHMKNFHLIGQKNHECSLCDRRFSAPHMLKAHMAVHSTEKEFKCIVCDKAFSRKKTLREHVRIHANDRRFKCEHCGMSFVQKCSLTGHLKNKHADKDQDKLVIQQEKCG